MKKLIKNNFFAGFALAFSIAIILAACVKQPPFVQYSTSFQAQVSQTLKPASLQQLQDIQADAQSLFHKVSPAVVNIKVNGASGTGVIVTQSGIILTAGHVTGKPDQRAKITFPNGTSVYATTLGSTDDSVDCGMIKINPDQLARYNHAPTTKNKIKHWPIAKIGNSNHTKVGQWVIALGHPGGYIPQRGLVLRIGRVIENHSSDIITDCTIVGGDSGGPLFDRQGNVIAIHKSIGTSLTQNLHVPISRFLKYWPDLLASTQILADEKIRRFTRLKRNAALGVQCVTPITPKAQGARVQQVYKLSPTFIPRLKVNDLIIQIGKQKIKSAYQLYNYIGKP